MEMKTLDDYLDEVDHWKSAASNETQDLRGKALAKYYREVRARFQGKLGRTLSRAADAKQTHSIPS